MSMLDEDEEYEDGVLYERRGTPFLRSARPELVVPTSSTTWLWPGAPNSWLWPRACAATGKGASEAVRFRCGGWSLRGRVAFTHQSPVSSSLGKLRSTHPARSTGMRRSNLTSTILTSGREIAMCACWLLGLLMLYGKRASTYIADNVAERLRRCTRKFLG